MRAIPPCSSPGLHPSCRPALHGAWVLPLGVLPQTLFPLLLHDHMAQDPAGSSPLPMSVLVTVSQHDMKTATKLSGQWPLGWLALVTLAQSPALSRSQVSPLSLPWSLCSCQASAHGLTPLGATSASLHPLCSSGGQWPGQGPVGGGSMPAALRLWPPQAWGPHCPFCRPCSTGSPPHPLRSGLFSRLCRGLPPSSRPSSSSGVHCGLCGQPVPTALLTHTSHLPVNPT